MRGLKRGPDNGGGETEPLGGRQIRSGSSLDLIPSLPTSCNISDACTPSKNAAPNHKLHKDPAKTGLHESICCRSTGLADTRTSRSTFLCWSHDDEAGRTEACDVIIELLDDVDFAFPFRINSVEKLTIVNSSFCCLRTFKIAVTSFIIPFLLCAG